MEIRRRKNQIEISELDPFLAELEPELRRLFQNATQTVGADLEQLNGNEKSLANRTLRIPTKHADAWLCALNQARLVIAAKNNYRSDRAGT